MVLAAKVRVGKKRVLVIPKDIAENVGIEEGTLVEARAEGNKVVIEPIYDAVWLSLHGEKLAKLTLEGLEKESLEQQRRYLEA